MRTAFREVVPDGVVLCEGPKMRELFALVDATLDWGIHRVMERPFLCGAQGHTDTYTMGYSLDDLHQLMACGAKLALSQPFLEGPRGASASARVAERRRAPVPKSTDQRHYYASKAFFETHQWRNSALLAGLTVPGLDDVTPRRGQREKDFEDIGAFGRMLDALEVRCRALDEAIGSARSSLGAPTAHIARLCRARTALSPIVDDGGESSFVDTGRPTVPAWSFRSGAGTAFTAANTEDSPVRISLPRRGRWRDAFAGETLAGDQVEVPAHGVRLLTLA